MSLLIHKLYVVLLPIHSLPCTDFDFPTDSDIVADLPEAEAAELQDKLSVINSMMSPEVRVYSPSDIRPFQKKVGILFAQGKIVLSTLLATRAILNCSKLFFFVLFFFSLVYCTVFMLKMSGRYVVTSNTKK